MYALDLERLSDYIESKQYMALLLFPSFATVKPDTVYNDANHRNGADVIIDEVSFENEDFRITLHADGTWNVDLWRDQGAV